MGRRYMPSDSLTPAELKALRAFADGHPKDVVTAARYFGITGMSAGNFGGTVRRLYHKGRLSWRHPECDYRITNIGRKDLGQ